MDTKIMRWGRGLSDIAFSQPPKSSEGNGRRHPLYILTRTMAVLVRTHRSVQEVFVRTGRKSFENQ